ncbi:MAG: bifunctional nuclease family protein [Nitrospinota bacterium]|nr:MAG: bifunctional nuclease family protein [Nitrospinota bacterium]
MEKMKIGMVVFDQSKGAAVITLIDDTGKKALPLLIGIAEALAIFRELNRYASPRPMIYDLFKNVLDGLQVSVDRVVIDSLQDETYYANIYMHTNGTVIVADARPSDGIVLALKAQVPIYVVDGVLKDAEEIGLRSVQAEGREREELQNWLDNLRPEDFRLEEE